MKKDKTPIQILGVEFEALSEEQLYGHIGSYLKGDRPRSIFTPNPEILFNATKDARLMQSLKGGDLLLPDGIGVKLAARFLGHKEHIRYVVVARPDRTGCAEGLVGHDVLLWGKELF